MIRHRKPTTQYYVHRYINRLYFYKELPAHLYVYICHNIIIIIIIIIIAAEMAVILRVFATSN